MPDVLITMPLASTVTVAQWVIDQVRRGGELRVEVAVGQIRALFGAQFMMTGADRTLAVRASVIGQIRRLSGGQIDFDVRRRCFSTASLIAGASLEAARQIPGSPLTDAARGRLNVYYKQKILEAEAKIASYTAELGQVGSPSGRGSVSGQLQACRTDLATLRKKLDALEPDC